MCDMTHVYVWHDSCLCVTWLILMCDITNVYAWHDSFTCATWLILCTCNFEKIIGRKSSALPLSSTSCTFRRDMTHFQRFQSHVKILNRFRKEDLGIYTFCWYLRIQLFIVQMILFCCFQKVWWYKFIVRLTPLYRVFHRLSIHTSSHAQHDSCLCVTRLMHVCDMTHVYAWHDSFTCATWLMPCTCTFEKIVGSTTLFYVRNVYAGQDSFTCATWLMPCTCTFEQIVSPTTLIHMTHFYVWWSFTSVTWLFFCTCSLEQIVVPTTLIYMTYFHVRWDSFTCVTWLIFCTCSFEQIIGPTTLIHVTSFYELWDSFTCVTWLMSCTCNFEQIVGHTTLTWLISMCGVTHSRVRNDSCRAPAIWEDRRLYHSHLHDFCLYIKWLIHVCDMTHFVHLLFWKVRRLYHSHPYDLFLCVTWLIHVCDMTHAVHLQFWEDRRLYHSLLRDKCLCGTRLIHVYDMSMCDMTHWRVRHDSCPCLTWLIYVCDVTHAEHKQFWEDRRLYHSLLRDKCLCGTRLIHVYDMSMCDMTHWRARHDSCPRLTWLIYVCDVIHAEHRQFWEDRRLYHSLLRDKCLCVTRLPHVGDMTHVYMWHDSFTCATWLMPNTCNFEKIVGPATLICTAVCPYRCCV